MLAALIDNYDSFTWNLAHRLGELGAEVKVVRNDAITLDEIERLAPARLVISPGPGRPETAGVTVEALRRFAGRLPMLGVCLGHQALVDRVRRTRRARAAPDARQDVARRARRARICSPASRRRFEVGRYHSLVIPPDAVPRGFVVTAWVDDDGTIMGVRHESWPVFGVQFHPESVLTPVGHRLLQNFLEAR